ncbi:MAG TPA: tyrosine-type recombinase/integrase, partial [Planctomycetota bacterium]|nr:tyrosine-type recombinase/integrase [Planctomycetota bacterium]
RLVPYPAALEPVLEKLLPRIGSTQEANPYLFTDREGQQLKGDAVGKAFDKAVVLAKLHDFHFHDLRRTYASRLANLGVSLTVIAGLLGHGATYVTERYAFTSGQALEAAVALMDQVSRNLADGRSAKAASK